MSALPKSLTAALRAFERGEQTDRRSTPRFALLIQASKLRSPSGEILCVVKDASPEGVRIQHFGHLPSDEELTFQLANGEEFPVALVWQDEEFAGLKFPDEVDVDRLVRLASAGLPRRPVRMNTMLEGMISDGTREHCITVRNISQQGACIECRDLLDVGQVVQVETDTLGPVNAKVRWRLAIIYGLVFEEPLECEQLATIVADTRRHH